MSVTFEDSQTKATLWNPASKVGILFHNQIKAIEQTYSLQSGISEGNIGDDYVVNSEQFRCFIDDLIFQLNKTHHPYEYLMMRGTLAMALIIHWQALQMWPVMPQDHVQLNEILGEAQSTFSRFGLPT